MKQRFQGFNLSLRFETKVLEEHNIFLGLLVMNTNEGIFISKTIYVKEILKSLELTKVRMFILHKYKTEL